MRGGHVLPAATRRMRGGAGLTVIRRLSRAMPDPKAAHMRTSTASRATNTPGYRTAHTPNPRHTQPLLQSRARASRARVRACSAGLTCAPRAPRRVESARAARSEGAPTASARAARR
eukprot:6925422-Prymnesium_polylepis.1